MRSLFSLCLLSVSLACDYGWTPVGRRCFKLMPYKRVWNRHNWDCMHDGGSLVSIHNEEENEAVRRLANGRDVYIGGLSYYGAPWGWSDHTPFNTNRFWAEGVAPKLEPWAPCVKMDASGYWYSNCCRYPPAPAVCARDW